MEAAAALFERDEAFRYPHHGHVLYLSVSGGVRGPTCVWEDGYDGAVTVVPAVTGRLLRFSGELVHGVPRPVDCWTAPHGFRAPPQQQLPIQLGTA